MAGFPGIFGNGQIHGCRPSVPHNLTRCVGLDSILEMRAQRSQLITRIDYLTREHLEMQEHNFSWRV